MARHKWADLIHAWAEGETVEYLHEGKWWTTDRPQWHEDVQHRIKPKKPEWYEKIPEHGVLCWVGDDRPADYGCLVEIIKDYDYEESSPFMGKDDRWTYATPLTDDEIRQFLRGE